MTRELRAPRFLAALPAPVRWLAVPTALACTVVVLVGSWSGPEKIETPDPAPKAAGYCRALAAALPQELFGHPRKDPTPASPFVAAWASSPKAVLRCGVDRPDALNGPAALDVSPMIDDVTWWPQELGDGGYRYTTTMRKAYVELTVPKGSFANPMDVVAALSPVVAANVP
ncbi:DUF3515 domain-containing protein [Kitasatospora purpeofusca]|uniref:DUF3515 domain-containing protein n=1 Tax=Kitasatospora purpeofusca TaxID=67352 RepID=UPI0035E3590F